MDPVRHRRFISALAVVIALEVAVGVVALSSRTNAVPAATSARPGSGAGDRSLGILAAGQFSHRRAAAGSSEAGQVKPASTTPSSPPPPAAGPAPGTAPPATGATSSTTTAPAVASTTAPPTTAPAAPLVTSTSRATGPATTASPPAGSAAATAHSGGHSTPSAIDDKPGDTVSDDGGNPITENRGDVVHAGAVYRPGALTLTFQVRQPGDPLKDPHWSGNYTYATWGIDTDNDGNSDYQIQYSVDQGRLGGAVLSAAKPNGPAVCQLSSATYGPDGYSATVDPACIGNPASVAFRVKVLYDTDPGNDAAEVASDSAPDAGWAPAVMRP